MQGVIILALDFDRWETGRKRAGSGDAPRREHRVPVVKIGEIAGFHIDRAEAQAHVAPVDALEIDQPLQGLDQRLRVVMADPQIRIEQNLRGREKPGRKKP
ncbi:hypothetical protein A8M32_19230 [Sinorhizobium alkalisoli]|uniref:Uncharacterized protein n=1 Tax=Sinorhizobium alkalisoli TaxID=1752398 RepID=A0A1E3V9R8_9HYPH|nr:hypothetical protein A8M32_19230 [Sinorhizobium alkalisoli]